jgi:hypothetical protein
MPDPRYYLQLLEAVCIRLAFDGQQELFAKVGDGMKVKAAYRGGVQRPHFSTEGVIPPDRH